MGVQKKIPGEVTAGRETSSLFVAPASAFDLSPYYSAKG
ncbi:hypothetical protein FRUB_07595 [Fimbriiglobus ruber]|uniref:Uncharacterized protein n=1 Tax=Fimbriiglobus ruber TaxID=1908690 RepID=A0A225DQ08_9BACT|nr:hypothetical protein FRUB_07595 [Fimbriiglobus ruber]